MPPEKTQYTRLGSPQATLTTQWQPACKTADPTMNHSSKFTLRPVPACLLAALATVCMNADAGRPLATEDAGTNPQAQCQFEAWHDRAGDGDQATHLAPACGLIDGLELGLEWLRAAPMNEQPQARAVALKWAPEWLAWQGWRFGLKVTSAHEKAPGEAQWHQSSLWA